MRREPRFPNKNFIGSTMMTMRQSHPHHENTIHSGHFMVSYVHEDDQQGDDKEAGETVLENVISHMAQNVPHQHHHEGSIDVSLAVLFRHMTLAYSGKLVSPKWKNFKGIKVKLKEKIRLNNIIWREWFMQYIKKKKSVVCQFEVPAFEKTHCRPEAIVLEGKYWKRQLQCLTTEYQKWRRFYKEKGDRSTFHNYESTDDNMLDKLCNTRSIVRFANEINSSSLLSEQFWSFMDSNTLPDFPDDTLFSSINQPFAFPDPREIVQGGFSKIVQPHLLQLQPSLEEFMEIDNIGPLPVFHDFRSFRAPKIQPSVDHETLIINEIQRQLMNEESKIQNRSHLPHPPPFPPPSTASSSSSSQPASLLPLSASQFQESINQFNLDLQQIEFSPVMQNNLENMEALRSFRSNSASQNAVSEMFAPQNILEQNQTIGLVQKQEASRYSNQTTRNNMSSLCNADVCPQQPQCTGSDFPFKKPTVAPVNTLQNQPGHSPRNKFRVYANKNSAFNSNRTTPASLYHVLNSNAANNYHTVHAHMLQQILMEDDGSDPYKRRASTGSVPCLATSVRSGNKKHVSFAIPDQPKQQPQQQQQQRSKQQQQHYTTTRPPEMSRCGVLKASKQQPSHQGLLERLLLQGKPQQHQTASSTTHRPQNCSLPDTRQQQQQQFTSDNNNYIIINNTNSANNYNTNSANNYNSNSANNYNSNSANNQNNSNSNSIITIDNATFANNSFNSGQSGFIQNNDTTSGSIESQTSCIFQTDSSLQFPSSFTILPASGSNSTFNWQEVIPKSDNMTSSQPSNLQIVLLPDLIPAPSIFDQSNSGHNESSSNPQSEILNISDLKSNLGYNSSDLTIRLSNESSCFQTHLNNQSIGSTNFGQLIDNSQQTLKIIDNPFSSFQEGSSLSSLLLDQPMSSSSSSLNRSRHSSSESIGGHHGQTDMLKDQKRTHHVSAEQQRRCKIKSGFDILNKLVPELNRMNSNKINKATTLMKAADFCKNLKHEKEMNMESIKSKKLEIEQLNIDISNLQQRLPATGIGPPVRSKTDRTSAMMKEYIYQRTMENWKFWIFSVILKSWMDSYNESVVTNSKEQMIESIQNWLGERCTLPVLREGVMTSLCHLCKTTSILEEPSILPQQARLAVCNSQL